MTNPQTGEPRGFGFVTFDSEESVQKVMDMKADHMINDKWIEVKRATPKGEDKGKGGSGGGKGGKGGGGAWGGAPTWGGDGGWGAKGSYGAPAAWGPPQQAWGC